MNKFFSIALLALVAASCQSSGDRKPPVDSAPAAPTTFNLPPAQVPDSNQPATITNGAATAALNPEHGAPGHRCDIPVGAPLNSPANSAPIAAPSSNPAPINMKMQAPTQPVNNNINTNVRLNPAHGQPGHDCAIPVGQPLRS